MTTKQITATGHEVRPETSFIKPFVLTVVLVLGQEQGFTKYVLAHQHNLGAFEFQFNFFCHRHMVGSSNGTSMNPLKRLVLCTD